MMNSEHKADVQVAKYFFIALGFIYLISYGFESLKSYLGYLEKHELRHLGELNIDESTKTIHGFLIKDSDQISCVVPEQYTSLDTLDFAFKYDSKVPFKKVVYVLNDQDTIGYFPLFK